MRVLIHKSHDYTCKNKLQELILAEANLYNDVEADSPHTAEIWLKNALKSAHERCKTKCRPIEWRKMSNHKGYIQMYIPGLVHYSFFPIKQLPWL